MLNLQYSNAQVFEYANTSRYHYALVLLNPNVHSLIGCRNLESITIQIENMNDDSSSQTYSRNNAVILSKKNMYEYLKESITQHVLLCSYIRRRYHYTNVFLCFHFFIYFSTQKAPDLEHMNAIRIMEFILIVHNITLFYKISISH